MMRRFQRDKDHRKALLINLTKNLIKHKGINTTITKAKDLKSFAEKILTRSKEDSLYNRKLIASKLMNDWDIVTELFNEIGPKIKNRNGGYLRIIKRGIRKGDGAVIAYIELVDLPRTTNQMKNNSNDINLQEEKINSDDKDVVIE
jgi:large subunit ribosomal protein L17